MKLSRESITKKPSLQNIKSFAKFADPIGSMQIITIDDREFNQLLGAWKAGKHVGTYYRNGKVQIVIATRQFMLVSTEDDQKKIAIKPARSLSDAESLALQLLLREEQRGNSIEVEPEYNSSPRLV